MVENKIYVKVIEGSEGYEPVKAVFIKDNVYKILDENNAYDELYNPWEFKPGEMVHCREMFLSGTGGKQIKSLVAFKKYEDS
ncbi:MAG: hypothetical protein EOM59_14590 [Clostridia bacterium]|jgi:hypothetical protein|nr:hypothetical protein [Clostridia bacterium]